MILVELKSSFFKGTIAFSCLMILKLVYKSICDFATT
jgi:hypothetical protein